MDIIDRVAHMYEDFEHQLAARATADYMNLRAEHPEAVDKALTVTWWAAHIVPLISATFERAQQELGELPDFAEQLAHVAEHVKEPSDGYREYLEANESAEYAVAKQESLHQRDFSPDIGGPNVEAQIRIAEAGRQLAEEVRAAGESTPGAREQAENAARTVESMADHMQQTNVAFRERIKNETPEKQAELMDARVDAQLGILNTKAEKEIAGLERTEPDRAAPAREAQPPSTPEWKEPR